MPLFSRSPNKPKTIRVDGRDFYKLEAAAARLGVEKSTLRKKLHDGAYEFCFGKLGTSRNAPLIVAAEDVETFLRGAARREYAPFIELSARNK